MCDAMIQTGTLTWSHPQTIHGSTTVLADHGAPLAVGMASNVNFLAIARADRPDMPSRRGRNDSQRAADPFFYQGLFGVPQHDAALTGRRKRLAGTFRNHSSFLLGQRRVDMQHERIGVLAELGHDERHGV